jgi:hypothetical protein
MYRFVFRVAKCKNLACLTWLDGVTSKQLCLLLACRMLHNKLVRNVGGLSSNYTASCPRSEYFLFVTRIEGCVASLSSSQLWYCFLGQPKLLVEIVHKLILLRTSHKKVAGCEIRRSWGPEMKRQVCVVAILFTTVRSSGSTSNFWISSFKCYVDDYIMMYRWTYTSM